MKNRENDISLFKILRKITPLCLKACPVYFTIFCLIGLAQCFTMAYNTKLTNNFFDEVTNYIADKAAFSSVIIALLVLSFCVILNQVLNGTVNFIIGDLNLKIEGKICRNLNLKSANMNPIDFENPLFLDDINKAQKGVQSSVLTVGIIFFIFVLYVPYFLFMGIYLYNLKPVLASSIFIIFVPIALAQVLKIKMFANLEDKVAPVRRQYEYYEKCIMDREYFKETRLLGCFSYFKKLYKDALVIFNKESFKTQKKAKFIEISSGLLSLSGYIIVLFLLVKCVLDKSISIGAFGAVFGSLDLLVRMMLEIIQMHIGRVAQNIGTAKNLVRFLDMKERKGEDIELTGVPEIDVKNVSFKYPGSTKNSLSNLSLHINKGETVAIVGENGAGKSTFVRLLTGIYLTSEGDVEIDGHNTKDVSMRSLFKNISGVFQKFQRYKMTLNENVSISDTFSDVNDSRVNESIKKADLEVSEKKFPEGLNTMLSREFDGVDLSGGQWQRIAIARGFYKDHNMIVLDEPTAAIDPIEETKLYKKFKEMSEGKTSIIVTHRLGSAKIADKIVVLDKGKIAQVGTHDELINEEGKYKEMYEAQSKWYQEA